MKFPVIKKLSGYVFRNGKLQECIVISQKIIFDYEKNVCNLYLVVSDGKDEIEIKDRDFYTSEEDYKKGLPADVFFNDLKVLGITEMGSFAIIKDGKAVMEGIKPEVINVDCRNGLEYSTPELETIKEKYKIYTDIEIARQMAVLEVANLDGTKHVCEGALHKVLLNEEQKDAVRNFVAAYKLCHELGVGFAYYNENDEIYVWNKQNAETKIDYDCDNENWTEASVTDNEVAEFFKVPEIVLDYLSCDCRLAVRK